MQNAGELYYNAGDFGQAIILILKKDKLERYEGTFLVSRIQRALFP